VVLSTTKIIEGREVSQQCKGAAQGKNWAKQSGKKNNMLVSTWIDRKTLSMQMFDILSLQQAPDQGRLAKLMPQARTHSNDKKKK
jgi:hypothetical protein